MRGRRRGRSIEDRLAVRSPQAHRLAAAAGWRAVRRLPAGSRPRRVLLRRSAGRAYDAFNRRDMPAFLALFSADVVYDLAHVAGWPDRQRYHGHGGLTEMAQDWFATWDFWFELEWLHDLGGDRCVVLADDRMRGRGSGVTIESMLWTQIVTIEAGLCSRVDNYSDRDEALTAVGLEA